MSGDERTIPVYWGEKSTLIPAFRLDEYLKYGFTREPESPAQIMTRQGDEALLASARDDLRTVKLAPLVELAERRGLEVPALASRKDVLELIEEGAR